MKYRVVDTDNFGGDYPNEHWVSEPVPKEEAERIADERNKSLRDYSPRYWKVVQEDYQLQPGFEP